eukprot:TRINITY_DN2940_c1_g3_i2.p2 TRINITY_DN2940_c1_g3~~TRINITY_DN2940_c1_g3_i2.p2  ORF type:complete len:894 (-),score=349.06 TRINITY_DN2940_c1_g3_i2:16642-19323(-)
MSDERRTTQEILLENEEEARQVEEALSEAGGATTMEIPDEMPVLPVRDIVVFNYMILPLFVGREKSVAAVDAALNSNRFITILTQRDESVDEPGPDDLYEVGTVAMIMRMLKMPDGRLKVLVQGVSRAKVKEFTSTEPHLQARVETIEEPETEDLSLEQIALMRAAKEQSEKILTLRGISPSDIMAVLNSVEEPGRLADLIASNLRLSQEDAQAILEERDPMRRLSLVNDQLVRELELATMQAKIQSSAKEGMDKAQKDFFLREQMKAIRKELGEEGEESEEFEQLQEALEKAGLPKEVKKEADKQLKRLTNMHPDSSEATVVRTYLDWLIELPWKKASRDRLDIKKAHEILDEDHYDLQKVKDRILEYLSVRKLNPKMKGPILCFVGPPGVGKTSLGRSIARALNRKFVRMSLGGMRDEAEIRGHRRTYIGSMPGRIIQSIKQAGTRNPVIMLDEIDKVGTDFRGDPSSALLEVLDPEQNFAFNDHYLDTDYNLSEVMFITTANTLYSIPAPLQDRMEIIRLPGYTELEKLGIATQFLLPKQAKANGLKPEQAQLSDNAILEIARRYTREAGVRNLEREIASVCRKVAKRLVSEDNPKGQVRVPVSAVESYLGVPKFRYGLPEEMDHVGLANGLAWTETGGEVLTTEAIVLPGKGKLTITGKLGEVMQESAQAALSYVRSRGKSLGLPNDFYTKVDLHIHVPEGAIPKDGPSAGITLATALVSALTRMPAKANVAMTGEITLRGRVLPIGGLREKLLAAHRGLITKVLIPADNAKDLKEVPDDILKGLEIVEVEHMDQVLEHALLNDRDDLFDLEECEPVANTLLKGYEPEKQPANNHQHQARAIADRSPDQLSGHMKQQSGTPEWGSRFFVWLFCAGYRIRFVKAVWCILC